LTTLILLLLVGAAFCAGFVVYPQLPERIASHWNVEGQADATLSKTWGIFLFPLIMALLFALYAAIPYLDPLKKNIQSFRRQYNLFWLIFSIFMAYVYALSLLWNIGSRFDISRMLMPAIAVLWYVLGSVLQQSKRNWFMGIRTPWTLSNDVVWHKTHQLGGKLFKLSALIVLVSIFVPSTAWHFLPSSFPRLAQRL